MNETNRELAIARCADGELSDVDQRRLLEELEQSPEGWRELALAFVERQVWDQVCHELVADPPATRPAATAAVRARLHSGKSFRWAAAAGLLVALGVGFGAGQWTGRRPAEGEFMVLDSPPVNPAAMPSSPGERPEMDPAREDSHAAGRLTAIPVSSRSQAPETLDFPLPVGDDRTESLQIPVYDPSSWPRSSTSSRRAILTEDQEQALQQQGYRVRRTRQVVAVPVRDGASVLVPVDAYGLQYEIQ